MKDIIFVTSNKGKIASAQEALKDVRVTPYHAHLIEPRSDDLKTIARAKVEQAYGLTGQACIAMDSGFFIEAWQGFPRAYVNPVLETLGIEGLLKLMVDIDNRACSFKTCLAYYDGVTMKFFESESPGHMAKAVLGHYKAEQWSDLWYIFKPLTFDKTLAQFDDEDFIHYESLSKASAMTKFGQWYQGV